MIQNSQLLLQFFLKLKKQKEIELQRISPVTFGSFM